MELNKVRLGDFIEVSTANNKTLRYGSDLIRGVTTEGFLRDPKGDVRSVDLAPYKIVRQNAFVYNPSRLDLGSIARCTEELCIVSHLYIVFYLNAAGLRAIDPAWLYMYLRRSEFMREVTFRNFGSQRPEFNFKKMSDIELPLPPIEAQRKYVAIYEAMLANQRAYEKGLDDLKLTCDALLDRCKKSKTWEPVGKHLREVDVRNADGKCDVAYGINIKKEFMLSKASSDDLLKYKLVKPGQIACNLLHVGRDASYPIAVNETGSCIAVSPAYSVFIASNTDMALFLMAWFSRAEIGRNGWFICDDSIRGSMAIDRFLSCEIPIPDGKTLKAIAELRTAYWARARINVYLKAQLKDICPILIRGSVEEASR